MCDTGKIIIDAVSAAIALGALVVSVWQYIKNSKRKKNEDTINAYEKLQSEVFSKLNILLKDFRNDRREVQFESLTVCSDDWEEFMDLLTHIEIFSAGVNTGIYDIEIVKRIGKPYIIERYKELDKVIQIRNTKEISEGNGFTLESRYHEFTKLKTQMECSKNSNEKQTFLKRMWTKVSSFFNQL